MWLKARQVKIIRIPLALLISSVSPIIVVLNPNIDNDIDNIFSNPFVIISEKIVLSSNCSNTLISLIEIQKMNPTIKDKVSLKI